MSSQSDSRLVCQSFHENSNASYRNSIENVNQSNSQHIDHSNVDCGNVAAFNGSSTRKSDRLNGSQSTLYELDHKGQPVSSDIVKKRYTRNGSQHVLSPPLFAAEVHSNDSRSVGRTVVSREATSDEYNIVPSQQSTKGFIPPVSTSQGVSPIPPITQPVRQSVSHESSVCQNKENVQSFIPNGSKTF